MVLVSCSIEDIIRGIQESTYEIQTESRLAYSGLKREQHIAGLLKNYAWLYNPETVQQVQQSYHVETDPMNRERLRRVYYHLLEGYLKEQTAFLEDELIAFEAGATVQVDGERTPYYNVPVLIATERDFEERNRLQEASLDVVEESNSLRLNIWRIRLAVLADEFGFGSYTAYNAEKQRVDYWLLRSRMEDFLSNTEEIYATLMGRWVEETTDQKLGEIGSHHLSYISRVPQYDRYFREEKLIDVYERTLLGMGLDPTSQQNIHIDTAERPTKNPRARCYAPDPPKEVHLLTKPVGGLEDYMVFFHEAGHAQHFGNEDPRLDYVERVLSTGYALNEIYSFLMQHLTENQTWLRQVVGLPSKTAREVAYYAKLIKLLQVRRYAGKLSYELTFFDDPLGEERRNRELYASVLWTATGFFYSPQNYLKDMDPGYYSADYLRAWITESMLHHYLEGVYGEDWFANPDVARILRGLWATGESKENEDIARMIGYKPFDTTHLVRGFLDLGKYA